MADVFDDGNNYCCHVAVRASFMFVLFKVILGYPGCEMNPLHPKELIATTSGQYLFSPMYRTRYPNDLNCHWRITARNSSHYITVEILDSYIEYDDDCDYDYLRIYDGSTTHSPILGTYCGNTLPTEKSTGPNIFLRFYTDSSVAYKGFQLKYYSSPKVPKAKEDDGKGNKVSNTMVVVGGIVGGVLCSLLLLTFVCVCATTKKCQCCLKPRRTVHPNSASERSGTRRRVQPRIDNIQGSSTPSPTEHIPMQDLPIYTITPSAPPPYHTDSYCRPPDEPYPSHDTSTASAYRLPSSPPPPYSVTDPHLNIYSVPNYIPPQHAPLQRY